MEKVYRLKIMIMLFFLELIIYGCINDHTVFEKFVKTYPEYNLDSFNVVEAFKSKSFIDYILITPDSNKIISFAYFHKGNINMPKGSIYFTGYQEKFINGDTIYVSAYNKNKKLLYSFKHTSNQFVPNKNAIFIKGKYYYYYKYYYPKLNDYQKQFYENHEDSIIVNHVNQIPLFENLNNNSN